MSKPKRFSQRLRRSFITVAIVPIFILLLLFSCLCIYMAQNFVRQRTSATLSQIESQITALHSRYKQELLRLSGDEAVLAFLENGSGSTQLFSDYYSLANQTEYGFSFAISDVQGNFLLRSDGKDGFHFGYGLQADASEPTLTYSNTKTDFGTIYYYGYYLPIQKDGQLLGYVVYYTTQMNLSELATAAGAESFVVTNAYDTVLVSNTELVRNRLNKLTFTLDERGSVQLGESSYYAVAALIDGEVYIYALNSTGESGQLLFFLPAFILFVMLIVIVTLLIMAQQVGKQVARPMEVLMQGIARTRSGDLQSSITLHTGDEFEALSVEYNRMLTEIEQMMARNEELFERQKSIEFDVLRNQFNPHMIFNVLETMRYMLRVDVDKAEQLVLMLSRFLRYNLYEKKRMVPLHEDMTQLKNYIEMQAVRYEESMSYQIQLPQEAANILVPKFFLLPFVENSIKHGFQNREQFFIVIKVQMQQQELCATVTDNGGGMTQQRLAEVCTMLEEKDGNGAHIGIINMDRTLRLAYGEAYGIRLENREGDGLTVHARIPLGEERE